MFRESVSGINDAKQQDHQGDAALETGKAFDGLTQEEVKELTGMGHQLRRAEGHPGDSEPRMDFDRQDQAVQFISRPRVKTDPARDALLTAFGKATLTDRYLMPGETFQDLFARVASYYGDDEAHAQRLYDYISKLWFMPATPVLSNGGTDRGLPISCFLNEANDSLGDIVNLVE